MKKLNKKKKLLLMVAILCMIIIFVVLGFVIKGKIEQEKLEELKNQNIDLNSINCLVEDDSKCVKSIDVKYGEKDHNVKIKMKSSAADKEGFVSYSYLIYIDGKQVSTIDGGKTKREIDNFLGNIYVFDKNYLGILYQEFASGIDGYNLMIYKNGTEVEKGIPIIAKEQSICANMECNSHLNVLEEIEFDGSKLQYWGCLCDGFDKAGRISLSYDGETIVKKLVSVKKDLVVGGDTYCNKGVN